MEKVQLNLERFLPELRDLERKNVFTKDEISDIVAKRRGFEVACAKRDVQPADYLRYIEYEGRLEKLRRARAARIKKTTRKTLSDHSIAAHVTQLHRLSVRRFPASLALWDAFLSHSLSQASPVLVSRTLSDAIAMHPTHVPYWIMASRWESDGDRKGMGGGNEEAARRLCMRALRFLKGGKGEDEIWKEWIRVEVVFAERMRSRWALLGIGRGEEVKVKKDDVEMEVDGEEEEEGSAEEEKEDVEMPALPEASTNVELDQAAKKVESAAVVSGQEALREGAVAKVVIDSCLSSFNYAITTCESLITFLRTLPTVLRLPLLNHVYTSLASHHTSSDPSYANAVRILATRPLYDRAFDPKEKPELQSVEEGEIVVEGEALVDAVGEAVDAYWKACKGKGKGKAKATGSVEVWESFCQWLEQMEDEEEDENLTVFLSTHLSTALSAAPKSPLLSLLHLRHLLRTEASHPTILAQAKSLTTLFGSAPTPLTTREEAWVARVETIVALSTSADDIGAVFKEAAHSLPFSGRVWDVQAEWVESSGVLSSEEVVSWYETSVRRVLLADAVPPVGFESKFDDSLPPRELIPRRYVAYLTASALSPSDIPAKITELLASSPTLSLSFLSYLLSLPLTLPRKVEETFRTTLHSRIVAHKDAGPDEWLAFALEKLRKGDVEKSGEVVRQAGRTLKGGELKAFERAWARACDGAL